MASKARLIYADLDRDVETLLKYHPTFSKPGPGRPKGDTGPLLRSTIVLIHTAWENYVEQVIEEAAGEMFSRIATDHTQLPHWLRNAVAEQVKKGNPWDLAGSGWTSLARSRVEDRLRALNTPNCKNVEALASDLIGVPNILASCSWQNQPEASLRAALDELVHDIRGEIVHKGQTVGPLKLNHVKRWRKFVSRLVSRFDQELAKEFANRFGQSPWL